MAGKRGQNEGSIYWVATDERWRASVSLPDGRRKQHQARTKKEAQEWLTRTLRDLDQGTLPLGPDQTVGVFLDTWLSQTAARRLRPRVLRRYGELIAHVLPSLGKVPLKKLTPQQLDRLYNEKLATPRTIPDAQKKKPKPAPKSTAKTAPEPRADPAPEEKPPPPLSAATVSYIHRVLHAAFADAVKWDLTARNPCDRVDPPPVPRPTRKFLDVDEVKALLEAVKEDRLECLYILAVTTGLRQGELFGLKWEDINGQILQVMRTLQFAKGQGFIYGPPKSETSRRTVTLTPIALTALDTHRERQALERAVSGEQWQENGLLFTNTQGGPLHHATFYHRSWQPLLKKANLAPMPFHSLRHTMGSLLIDQGETLKLVQEVLGHSSIRVTGDIYVHTLPGAHGNAMERLSRRLAAAEDATVKEIAEDLAARQEKPKEGHAAGG